MNAGVQENRPLPLGAYLFLGWLVLFTVVPFSIILVMSFMEKTGPGSISFIPTLENYTRCFQWIYAKVLLKTLWVALTATGICLLVGFPVAYFLARSDGRLREIGLILLFIPLWTNFILRVHAIVSLLGNQGLLNQILLGLGWIESPLEILYTRLGVFIGLTYNYLPFLVVPIYSALEKLDPSLKEASFDLGASRFQTFWRVTVPCVREGVFVGSLFVFIPMLGEYVIPDLLGGAKEAFLGNVMVSQFFTMQDWPFGSALAGILSLFLLLAFAIRGTRIKAGMAHGS